MDDLLKGKIAIPDHVIFRRFPAEVVILNLETGKYHGLNPTAGRMLEVLSEQATVHVAVEHLAQEFEQPYERVASDVGALCDGLVQRGLVELHAGDGS